jgi:hypothetical protein
MSVFVFFNTHPHTSVLSVSNSGCTSSLAASSQFATPLSAKSALLPTFHASQSVLWPAPPPPPPHPKNKVVNSIALQNTHTSVLSVSNSGCASSLAASQFSSPKTPYPHNIPPITTSERLLFAPPSPPATPSPQQRALSLKKVYITASKRLVFAPLHPPTPPHTPLS